VPNIVLCYQTEPHHLEWIRRAAPEYQILDAGQEGIGQSILEADLFCGHAKVPVPWDDVVRQGRLQWIQSSAAGLDHCLVPSVIASDIPVTSSSAVFADQVAEQTMALLYGLFRRIPLFLKQQQQRSFVRRPTWDLHGRTIGIIGLGGNGRRIAELLAPLGNRIIAVDRHPVDRPNEVSELRGVEALDELLGESEIVILGVPLNSETYHLLNRDRIAQMRPGAVLINVARGPVVDEAAMIAAIQSGHIAAAGLDVTEIEPLPDSSPLWAMEQVLITPHVGAQAASRNDDATKLFCVNLHRRSRGEALLNAVDKQAGYPAPDCRLASARSLRLEFRERLGIDTERPKARGM